MKVSHTALETCRSNPSLWVASQLDASGRARFGFKAALLCAIHNFHSRSSNESKATNKLQEMLGKNFKNEVKIESTLLSLQKYIDWFSKQKIEVADSRFLVSQSFGSSWTLGGLVHRLDITDEGYRAILLTEPYSFWHQELRMPLLQEAVARKYGRPVEEVSIGIQDVTGAGLVSKHFGSKRTAKAIGEYTNLGAAVVKLLNPS